MYTMHWSLLPIPLHWPLLQTVSTVCAFGQCATYEAVNVAHVRQSCSTYKAVAEHTIGSVRARGVHGAGARAMWHT